MPAASVTSQLPDADQREAPQRYHCNACHSLLWERGLRIAAGPRQGRATACRREALTGGRDAYDISEREWQAFTIPFACATLIQRGYLGPTNTQVVHRTAHTVPAQSSTLEDSSVILPSVPGSAGNTAYVSDPRFPNLSKGASRPGHSEGNWVFILQPPRSCPVHVLRSCDTLSKRSMPALLIFWRSRFVHLSLPAAT